MKKLVIILPLLLLTGCMPIEQNTTISNNTSTKIVSTISRNNEINSNTNATIQNTISEQMKSELRTLYSNTKLTFSNIYTLGNYIIANADDWSNQPWSLIQIVAGKENNTRYKFYKWNSGEISCSIVEKFWFPKALLDAYYQEDYCGIEWGKWSEYTIPEETIKALQKK